jgi:hypothetical protein
VRFWGEVLSGDAVEVHVKGRQIREGRLHPVGSRKRRYERKTP